MHIKMPKFHICIIRNKIIDLENKTSLHTKLRGFLLALNSSL